MSDNFGDEVADAVHTVTTNIATTALQEFGSAAALALGEMTVAFVSGHAKSGGEALATALAPALRADLLGRIATALDAQGLDVGDARVATHLAAFASGEAAAPVDAVSAERTFPFVLGTVAALEAVASLRLKTSCGFEPGTSKPKTSASAKIKLELEWSGEPKEPAR